ncbi:hypothetical protein BDY19DRAFT_1054098 [Irpex rosettiformis]|uniref:Uncharacterized protein n=1 Tax=Irpex rosettiformis TaxID=378272 RepID=A0ACB8UG00_9APHY|nr:hypothetical protein BDY19DRAFT_1054098 [Irpex rosettiformis]
MSDLYTTLCVSPRKKRTLLEDDDNLLTPKRLRTELPTPPATVSRKIVKGKGLPAPPSAIPLPTHLNRLHNIQTALQHALSHALATCAMSPSSDTGIVRNVLNHLSLGTYTGLTTKFDIDDLRRLCWLWEWDGKALTLGDPDPGASDSKGKGKAKVPVDDDDDDNPFLDDKPISSTHTKDWTRGAMGFIITQTTHYFKSAKSRVPAYGIGIEVEMDIDKDMKGGMAAVARWTAASESRKKDFRQKLESWVDLHQFVDAVPHVPMAQLPPLPTPKQPSNLTRLLASSSPKSPSSASILATPTSPSPFAKSPSKSPSKRSQREFAIPFPITPSSRASSPTKSPTKNSILFPQTPTSRGRHLDLFSTPTSSRTPSTSFCDTPSSSSSIPSTPQRENDSTPQTPSSSRRAALYERIRQRSLSTTTPTKVNPFNKNFTPKPGMSKDALLKLSQEEMRRRCLLGRLSGVAESVWMLFSNPAGSSTSTPSTRKRRALPSSEVAAAVIKSSPVPISKAEAQESLDLLVELCPFFLKRMDVGNVEWLEMPASSVSSTAEKSADGTPTKAPESPSKVPDSPLKTPASPSKKLGSLLKFPISPSKKPNSPLKTPASPLKTPVSPGKIRGKEDSAEELITRSPRRVCREGGGLREVRERIRKELESQD